METKMPRPLGALSPGTKWIACVLLLSPISAATAQVKTGTVLYVDLSKDEFIVAADSRWIFLGGNHDDTECKIQAFGNQFVFSMPDPPTPNQDQPLPPSSPPPPH